MISAVLALAFAFAQAPDAAALNEMAKEKAQRQRYDEAEKLWKQALAASPGFFPAIFNLGFMYFSRAQYEQAEPLLGRAAALHPDDFNAHYLLGAARVHLGQREAGLREWRAALQLQPRNYKLIEVMAVEYGKGFYFKEAAEAAKRALELRGDDPNAYFVTIKACQDARDPAALDIARRAAAKFPDSARANFEYGFQLQKAGHAAEGAPYLKKAMAADPKYEEPFFFYGESLVDEGKYEEAIGYLRTALEDKPDYVAAAVALARALMELQRYEEAVRQLQRTASLSPRHPEPHLLLSRIYFRMGDESRARQEKEISLRLRRADASIMEAPQARPFPQ